MTERQFGEKDSKHSILKDVESNKIIPLGENGESEIVEEMKVKANFWLLHLYGFALGLGVI